MPPRALAPCLAVFLAVILPGCDVPLISGKPSVDELEDKIEEELTMRATASRMSATLGATGAITTASVDCPTNLGFRKGSTTTCDAELSYDRDSDYGTVGDHVVEDRKLTVTFLNDDGKYRWELQPTEE